MRANHQTDSKRAILLDLLQGQLTVKQAIEQKLFASEVEILDAIVELIDEMQRSRYVNKIEPQLTEYSPKPVVSNQPVAQAKVVSPVSTFHTISDKPLPVAEQTEPTHGPESGQQESEQQESNHSLAVGHYEQALSFSFPDTLHFLSDFQMFVVKKIREQIEQGLTFEQRLTLQTALDAGILSIPGMDDLTLAEQGAMVNDNAGNYIGATKLSGGMNMIPRGRGDHIADGAVTNDIQSEQNKDKTVEKLETQEDNVGFEESQDEQDDEFREDLDEQNDEFREELDEQNVEQANKDKEAADDKYEKTKIAQQAEANKEQARIDGEALVDLINSSLPTPSNTK
jgi:hypothetical protein